MSEDLGSTISVSSLPLKVSTVDQLPRWLSDGGICLPSRRHGFNPWFGKIPWSRKWQPTPVFLPGKAHGQSNLMGYSPQDCKKVRYDLVAKYQTQWTNQESTEIWFSFHSLICLFILLLTCITHSFHKYMLEITMYQALCQALVILYQSNSAFVLPSKKKTCYQMTTMLQASLKELDIMMGDLTYSGHQWKASLRKQGLS